MSELVKAVAILCQIYSTSGGPYTAKLQRDCQSYFAACLMKNVDARKHQPAEAETIFFQCMKDRK